MSHFFTPRVHVYEPAALPFVVVALVNNFKDSYVQWSLPITFGVRLLPFSKSTLGITAFESLHGIQKASQGQIPDISTSYMLNILSVNFRSVAGI